MRTIGYKHLLKIALAVFFIFFSSQDGFSESDLGVQDEYVIFQKMVDAHYARYSKKIQSTDIGLSSNFVPDENGNVDDESIFLGSTLPDKTKNDIAGLICLKLISMFDKLPGGEFPYYVKIQGENPSILFTKNMVPKLKRTIHPGLSFKRYVNKNREGYIQILGILQEGNRAFVKASLQDNKDLGIGYNFFLKRNVNWVSEDDFGGWTIFSFRKTWVE